MQHGEKKRAVNCTLSRLGRRRLCDLQVAYTAEACRNRLQFRCTFTLVCQRRPSAPLLEVELFSLLDAHATEKLLHCLLRFAIQRQKLIKHLPVGVLLLLVSGISDRLYRLAFMLRSDHLCPRRTAMTVSPLVIIMLPLYSRGHNQLIVVALLAVCKPRHSSWRGQGCSIEHRVIGRVKGINKMTG